ncbi:unnamed protein product [Adineta steineri]|uniref:Uncharacterized protein n=1 Tax=Adineta steineri TaxID=433720 RepID=A0A815I803_9BILA|nr:unnamed protein product [Adineta steineri]
MLSYNLILILSSSLYVVHSLKCHSCEFQIELSNSLPNQSSLPDECRITVEDDISVCKAYIQVNYLTDEIYIWWNAIPKDTVQSIANNLDIPLPLNRMQKSLTKFQFDVKFKPKEVSIILDLFLKPKKFCFFKEVFLGANIFCQSNDYCIINETNRLLSQLNALKHVSLKIQKIYQNLLIQSPMNTTSESIINCFHSYSDRIIQCTSSNDVACFIGIPETSIDIEADCVRNSEDLFVSISYYITNPISHIKNGKSSCSIHCNRDNCNTEEIYNNVIKIAQKYISG